MKQKKTRRVFSKEFKQQTVKLVTEGGQRASEVARDLEIHPNVLSKWIRDFNENEENSFPGKGKLVPEDEEIRRIKRELESVKQERDILKKVVAIFSRPQQ